MNEEKLVAVQRNYFGDIISFQTSEGRIISYRKALQEVEQGNIVGVEIIEQQDGHLSLETQSADGFDQYPTIY
ncbi:DUF3892 domain-containing protein [Bacillus dakarensis]|uniref:DUF3892 domain-containing protein n=1 Tax=Robertmurraya dakarensis TaxID=1926278 RepID=UPI0009815731|nr:DUF3892 domain-containing protein [Bacillus dakarensis]